MTLETLHQTAGAPPWLAEAGLQEAVAGGAIAIDGSLVRIPGFRPKVAGGDAIVADVVGRIDAAALTPPDAKELGAITGRADIAAVLRVAAAEGLIVAVERDRYFSRRALDTFVTALQELGEGGEVRIPPLKERLGLSRKFLIPLLEWSDREGLTVRQGDTRRAVTSRYAGGAVSK